MTELNPPSGIRLVALDIDDTLIPWGGAMSSRVTDAVRAVHAAGVEVVLATGRGVSAVVPVAEEIGLDEIWALCSNGSVTARIARRFTWPRCWTGSLVEPSGASR